LEKLKRDIAMQRYEIDSGAVAEAILRKLRLVRQGLLALDAGASDRTRPAGEPLRRT
jgi:hypothetical protein